MRGFCLEEQDAQDAQDSQDAQDVREKREGEGVRIRMIDEESPLAALRAVREIARELALRAGM